MLNNVDINDWIEQNAYKQEHSLSSNSNVGALSSYQVTHTWSTQNNPNLLQGPQQQLMTLLGQPWGQPGLGLPYGGVYPSGVYPTTNFPVTTQEHRDQSQDEFKEPLEVFYQESIDAIFKLQDLLTKMEDELQLHAVMRTIPKFDLFIRIEAIKAMIEDRREQLLLHYNSQLIAAKEFYEGKIK